MIRMKKFVSPEMEIIEFKVEDLIVASGPADVNAGGTPENPNDW